MRIGRRLAIKLLNASRLVLGFTESEVEGSAVTEPIDRSMLAGLAEVVHTATEAFSVYDHARALDTTERSFWNWTDDYLELVKTRAYGETPGSGSAHAALRLALGVYLRLFAPFLPFVTEEVWSWWREGSVHLTSWPHADEFAGLTADSSILSAAGRVLTAVRRTKSDAKVSMRAEVHRLTITADPETIASLKKAEPDLRAATNADVVEYTEGPFSVRSELADDSTD